MGNRITSQQWLHTVPILIESLTLSTISYEISRCKAEPLEGKFDTAMVIPIPMVSVSKFT